MNIKDVRNIHRDYRELLLAIRLLTPAQRRVLLANLHLDRLTVHLPRLTGDKQ